MRHNSGSAENNYNSKLKNTEQLKILTNTVPCHKIKKEDVLSNS